MNARTAIQVHFLPPTETCDPRWVARMNKRRLVVDQDPSMGPDDNALRVATHLRNQLDWGACAFHSSKLNDGSYVFAAVYAVDLDDMAGEVAERLIEREGMEPADAFARVRLQSHAEPAKGKWNAREIETTLRELVDSWINGNKKTVAAELAAMPPLVCALISAQIAVRLDTLDASDATEYLYHFGRFLQCKIEGSDG